MRDLIEEKLFNLPDISDKYNSLDEGLNVDFYNGMKIYYIIHPKFNPGDKIIFKEPLIEKKLEIEVIDDTPDENEEEEEIPVNEVPEGEEIKPIEKPIKYISMKINLKFLKTIKLNFFLNYSIYIYL